MKHASVVAILAALVLASCGQPDSGSTPSPGVTASPSVSPIPLPTFSSRLVANVTKATVDQLGALRVDLVVSNQAAKPVTGRPSVSAYSKGGQPYENQWGPAFFCGAAVTVQPGQLLPVHLEGFVFTLYNYAAGNFDHATAKVRETTGSADESCP